MRLIFRFLLIVSAVAIAVMVFAGLGLNQTSGVRCGDEVMSPGDRCAPMKTTFSAYQDQGRSYEEMAAVSDDLHRTQSGWLITSGVVLVIAATGAVVVWRRERRAPARAGYLVSEDPRP